MCNPSHQFTNSPIHQFTNSPIRQFTKATVCVRIRVEPATSTTNVTSNGEAVNHGRISECCNTNHAPCALWPSLLLVGNGLHVSVNAGSTEKYLARIITFGARMKPP